MEGRMQQTWPTQDSTGNLDEKFLCKNKKRKYMGDESSDEEEDRVFSCSSCPRKFSSQYAMAGHRNVHRSEWEFMLQDLPDEDKMQQRHKLPCNLKPSHLPNTTIALKQQSPSSTIHNPLPNAPRCPSINPMNKLKGPSPKHPMVNPTNTLKGPSPKHHMVNPTNSLILANSADSMIGSSLGVPHYTFFRVETLRKPLVVDLSHPLDNHVKLHGRSALGVRCFPMIHRSCDQYRHGDMWSRDGSTLFGQKSLLKAEGGCSSWTRNFISSFFQRRGCKVTETHDFFASTLAKERDNRCIYHSSEGLATEPNKNGENESSVDIDLDLKL